MSLTELSEQVGITMANLSVLKRDRAKRFSTLIVLCETLSCEPGDILELYKGLGHIKSILVEPLIMQSI